MKYDLTTVDGNAYCIMGYVLAAMRKEGYTKEQQQEYTKKAMSSDYSNLVSVSLDYIDKLNGNEDTNN